MFQTKVLETIKTHILCSLTFLENRAVYEIMWTNMVDLEKVQLTNGAWAIHAGCRRLQTNKQTNKHKHTHTHTHTHTLSICNNYCFFTASIVARMPRNITLYSHCLSFPAKLARAQIIQIGYVLRRQEISLCGCEIYSIIIYLYSFLYPLANVYLSLGMQL